MEKNDSAKGDDVVTVTNTIATTDKSKFQIITCRCCLSEADDEVTDFLPLDAVAAISVQRDYENDDAANDDICGGESSTCVSTIASATLLDCLNGCARIRATLDDTTLPLHICLDCSQALEACCEFIRCVQNADQILRRKRREATQTAQMASDNSSSIKVIDPFIVTATETPNLDGTHLASATNIQQVMEHKDLNPIVSLNLMDLIGDDYNNYQQLPATTLKAENIHENANQNIGFNLDINKNALTIRPSEQIIENTDQNSFRSSNLPLNTITNINFEFQKTSESSNAIEDLHSDIGTSTNMSNNEVTNFNNLKSISAKDCEVLHSCEQTIPGVTRLDISNAHSFISPFDKGNSIESNILVSKELPILSEDTSSKTTQYDSICDGTSLNDIKIMKYSTLECNERKYVVNAAIVKDLVQFHLENKGKQRYICMFCKFMCVDKQTWDQHLAIHLGAPRYKCTQCNFECRFKYYLIQHLNKVHRISSDAMHLKPKLDDESMTRTKYYCGLCQSYFTSFIALQQHHHINEEPYFKCNHCQMSETNRENLMEHLAMEHKVFIDAKLIVAYIPIASKPISTTDETNINKIFLDQFIRFHPKLTEHLCQYCGKSFQRRFHLLKHEYYVHPNDNKKENEKYFKRRTTKYARQQYTRHLRATQAEHQFKCDICHRVFKTAAERSTHVHQHHSTYFQCATCEATFAFEFELKYHMRTHNTSNSATSLLASPRYELHHMETSQSISEELKDRLHQLRQQKQLKKVASINSSARKRNRPITKRRLSLASVSTTKSSESSVNSPSNTNSDEDMPIMGVGVSSNITKSLEHSDINIAAISVADVMLPQPMKHANTKRRLSTTSITSLSKFCTTNSTNSSSSSFSQQPPPSTISDRSFHCDFNDQPYLNDFDLNLLECPNDFLLDFSSF